MLIENNGLSLDGQVIVLVEDDVALRHLAADIITELGGDCLAFESADDALIALLESHGRCSLIIADHGLPGQIKGAEFLTLVNGKWPAIPTILTSGYQLEVAHHRKPSEFLFKPWSLNELIDAMSLALTSAPDRLSPVQIDLQRDET